MNYRTMNLANGTRFYTVWTLFVMVRDEAERRSPLRVHLLRPEEFDEIVLNLQAHDLLNAEPMGSA